MALTKDELRLRVGVENVPAFVADAKKVVTANAEMKASAAAATRTPGALLPGQTNEQWIASTQAKITAMQAQAAAIGAKAAARTGSAAVGAEAAKAEAGALTRSKVGGAGMGAGLLGLGVSPGAAIAAASAYVIGSQLKAGIAYATQLQKVNLDTAAVIKSTKGAANETAPAIVNLSAKIGNLAGIQRNTVQASENVLLGFTKIRNEGTGMNAIFDRASVASANLSARLGTDLGTASLTVGKALQAPIQGVSTLRGQGVLFTNQQVDQIKVMTAAGNTMGAQKIILGQLDRQYQGAAASAGKGMPAALVRLNQAWADSRQKLIVAILPDMIKLTNWLAVTVPSAVDTTITAFSLLGVGETKTSSNFQKWLDKNDPTGISGFLNKQGNKSGWDNTKQFAGYIKKQGTFTGGPNVSGANTGSRADQQGAAERLRQQGAVGGVMLDEDGNVVSNYRGLGHPTATPVKIDWAGDVDPLSSRPVYLVLADGGKPLAQAVAKGAARTAHAQGKGSKTK